MAPTLKITLLAVCSVQMLAGCTSTPLDYASQETDLLCYMAIHDHDELAVGVISDRLPGGAEGDECQELAEEYRQELLRERAARRKQLEQMSGGSPRDPYESETPDLPEVRI